MAKKSAKSDAAAEVEAPSAPESHARVASKADAARAALKAGFEGPQEASDYIKKTFNVDMTPQHFSAVKSQLKKRELSGVPRGKPGRKPKSASMAVEGYLAPPPPRSGRQGGELLEAMETMKPLIASLGKDQVKRIVDLLG